MFVTLLGMVIDIRLLQPEKALPSIEIKFFGNSTEDKPVQPWKAELLIVVTP